MNSPIWPEIDFMPVVVKFEDVPINIFPIMHVTLWEILVAVETRVLIQSAPKAYAVFPPPQ